jgi:hypothetical protein
MLTYPVNFLLVSYRVCLHVGFCKTIEFLHAFLYTDLLLGVRIRRILAYHTNKRRCEDKNNKTQRHKADQLN